MQRQTQCDQVLRYLKHGGMLDPLIAQQRYGIMRLAARICDLRERGIKVKTQMCTSRNGKRFARYYL